MKKLKQSTKDWLDLAYNAHSMLRDYYTYDEIMQIPIKNLLELIDYFTPKMKEIARRQENQRMQAELSGKPNMKRPGRSPR